MCTLSSIYLYHSCIISYIAGCRMPVDRMFSTKQYLIKEFQKLMLWTKYMKGHWTHFALYIDRSISFTDLSVAIVWVCNIVNVTYVWNGMAQRSGSLYIRSCTKKIFFSSEKEINVRNSYQQINSTEIAPFIHWLRLQTNTFVSFEMI